jgi:hypothetical protein
MLESPLYGMLLVLASNNVYLRIISREFYKNMEKTDKEFTPISEEQRRRDQEYLIAQKREQLSGMIDSWISTLSGLRQQVKTVPESTLDASLDTIRRGQQTVEALEALRNLNIEPSETTR